MRQCRYFLFFIIVLSSTINAQNIDSFKLVLDTAIRGPNRAFVLNELAWFSYGSDIDTCILYANQALELSTELGLLKDASLAENMIGNVLKTRGNSSLAIIHFEKALEYRLKLGDDKLIGQSYNNIGNYYRSRGNYVLALENYLRALESLSKIGESKELIKIYNNLSIVYRESGSFAKAMESLGKCMDLARKDSDQKAIANSHLSYGTYYQSTGQFKLAESSFRDALVVFNKLKNHRGRAKSYHNLGNSLVRLNEIDSALHYFFQALAIKEAKGYLSDVPKTCNNIGVVLMEKGSNERALPYFKKSLEVNKEIGNEDGLLECYLNFGELFLREEQYDSSMAYCQKVLTISEKSGRSLKSLEALFRLSVSAKYLFGPDSSLHFLNSYVVLADSVKERFGEAVGLQFEMQQETAKRELRDQEYEQQIQLNEEQNKRLRMLWISLGLLIIVSLVSLWAISLRKKKIILEKDQKEKELWAMNEVLQAQELERQRIATDLHDSTGVSFFSIKGKFKQSLPTDLQAFQVACEAVDELAEEIREIAYDLFSKVLKKFGLVKAIEELVAAIEKSTKIEVDFVVQKLPPRLEESLESTIYKVVKELVSNVIRHSGASQLSIQLLRNNGNLNLLVEDNGQGFEMSNIVEGIGLKSIRSRIVTLKGTLNIDTGRGSGTSFIIDIPLK